MPREPPVTRATFSFNLDIGLLCFSVLDYSGRFFDVAFMQADSARRGIPAIPKKNTGDFKESHRTDGGAS
jgi:hypothetical protein